MTIDKFGDARYKVGLHLHTDISDGQVTPERAAQIYREAGFDAIAITDHWKYHAADRIGGLTVIPGCEYNLGARDTSVDVIHIVGVGMKKDPGLVRYEVGRQETIDAIRACGGLAILAHPAWSLNTPQHALELDGIAAVEIYNSVSAAHQSSRAYSGYFVDLCANLGMTTPLIATDDSHYYDGTDATLSYIMVRAGSGETGDILAAVEAGDFYATQGPELYARRIDGKIIVDCSPVCMINFLSNSAWCPDRICRGEGLTHAEYEIKDFEKWVRVELCDENGKAAWSNLFAV